MAKHVWRNIFREFLDWCRTEKKLDVDDLRARWKEQLLASVESRIAGGLEPNAREARRSAARRFNTHSNISLWGGDNGAHRRISPRNYFIFEDSLVAQFNRGRAETDRLTISNYVTNTPPSTQNVGKGRKRAPRRTLRTSA